MSPNRTTELFASLLLLWSGLSLADDGFGTVKCGSEIPKALIGQVMPNEAVFVIEGRHKDLGLRDLGATEISGRLSSISWLICGKEFMLLEDDHFVVRDVLEVPPHSKKSPAFIGSCMVNNQKTPDVVFAVLNNKEGMDALPADAAWKIDEKMARFIKMNIDGLQCPRMGIFTEDGGQ